jgi:hypothetical protein
MPKKSPHPHVAWRDGRPRFSPGPELRAAGHAGRDLRHDDGCWYSRGECVDWSEAFVKSLSAAQAAEAKKSPAASAVSAAPTRKVPLYTLARLFEDWFKSQKFQLPENSHELARQRAAGNVYSPKTVRDYKQKARVIENHDPSLWASPVDALSQPVLLGLYEELVTSRGRAQAHGALLVLSSALGWGKRRGKFSFRSNQGVNPALDLGMSMSPPRERFGSRAEISTLIAVADHMGWPEFGDMIVLGVWTGQRQEDRLLMLDKGLLNGRRFFKQLKTNALVSVREAPELEARMAAARARRVAAGVVNPRVILDEERWQPFPDDGDRYRKKFAKLRAIAAAGVPDEAATAELARQWAAEARNSEPPTVWRIKPCPSLEGDAEAGILPFYENDLRSTAVVWMALAGATIPEIISVTGHALASATNILKHYLVTHPEMADSALKKMIDWYDADGETELGL